MAVETRTTLDKLLKEVYEGQVADLTSQQTRLINLFKKQKVHPWEGRQVVRAVRVTREEGVLAVAEDGPLPIPEGSSVKNFTIPMRYLAGRIEFSAQLMKSAKSNRGAFQNALDFKMGNLIKDLANDRNRVIAGFGSGILCLVNGAMAALTSIECDAPGGFAGATNGTRYVRTGARIAFVAPGTSTERNAQVHKVSSVTDHNTFVITPAAGAAVADNDEIIRGTDSDGVESAADIEPEGIFAGVDDGTLVATYHGLLRSDNPDVLNSALISSVGAFSTDAIYRALFEASQRGDASINSILGGFDSVLEYIRLTEADRRYPLSPGQAGQSDAGTKGFGYDWKNAVPFSGIPVQGDKDFPFGKLVGLDLSAWYRYVQADGEWVDDDGAVLFRAANKDNFQARYRVWENFHCDRPAAQFRLDGITTTVPTFHIA